MTFKSTNAQSSQDPMVPQPLRKNILPSPGSTSTYPRRQLAPLATAAAGVGGGQQLQHVATSMRTAEHIVATIGARRHNAAAAAVAVPNRNKAVAPLPPKQAVFIKALNQSNTANYTNSHLSQKHITSSTGGSNSHGLTTSDHTGIEREPTLPHRPFAGQIGGTRRTSLPLTAVDVTTPKGGFLWQPFIADTRNLTLASKAQQECLGDSDKTEDSTIKPEVTDEPSRKCSAEKCDQLPELAKRSIKRIDVTRQSCPGRLESRDASNQSNHNGLILNISSQSIKDVTNDEVTQNDEPGEEGKHRTKKRKAEGPIKRKAREHLKSVRLPSLQSGEEMIKIAVFIDL